MSERLRLMSLTQSSEDEPEGDSACVYLLYVFVHVQKHNYEIEHTQNLMLQI